MSSRPYAATVFSITSSTCAGTLMSHTTYIAMPPAASIAATTPLSSASRRAQTHTWAPCAAKRLATSAPMPLLPPVTTATLPASDTSASRIFKGFSSGAATGWLVSCSGFFARPRLLPCASFKSLRGKNSACVSIPGVWPTYHVYCEARSALPSTLFLRCVLLVDLRRSITSHARCEMHHTTVLYYYLYTKRSPRDARMGLCRVIVAQ